MLKALFYGGVAVLTLAVPLIGGSRAIAQVAPGVTQSAAKSATITGTVVSSTGNPVPNANVTLTGPSILNKTTDDHGLFTFTSVPFGVYQISVTSPLGTATKTNVTVNGDINVVVGYEASTGNLKTIARVSTTSAGASINVTPASITSISPSDYAFQGNTGWKELLDKVPGVAVGGGLRNGISCGAAIAGGPFQPTVLSINGAAPYETSVTLDGMPLQNVAPNNDLFYPSGGGGGTDISFLPLASFDTADVVRGPGANAPSIVDSIGGAFVLHAPGAVSANHFQYSIGNDMYGGVVTNAQLQLKLGKLSTQITYGLNVSPGPLGDHANIIFAGAGSWPYTINGQYTAGGGFGGSSFVANNHVLLQIPQTVECCLPYSTASTSHSGAIALSYAVSPSVTAQVFYAGSSTQANEPDAMWLNQFSPTPNAGYTGSFHPGIYPLISATEEGPMNKGESMLEEKITAYIGKGVLRVAALQNNSFFQISFPALIPNGTYRLYGTVQFANNPGTTVAYNGTPEALTFFPCGPAYDYYWVNNRDLTASYGLQLGANTNVNVGWVSSYYNAPYEEQFLVFGTPYPEPGRPSAVSQSTNEFHISADTQVSDKLTLTGAWYFTQGNYHVINPNKPGFYSDSNFPYNAPRVSGVWRANRDTAIRLGVGGGFALPPLLSLIGTNTISLPCTTICSESKTNLNLQPETSFGWDVGTDMRFHTHGSLSGTTVLSFDLYQTNLYGQFYQQSTPEGTCSTCGGLPLFVTQVRNIAQSRYEGINMTIRHDPIVGPYWSAAVGLTRAYVVSVPPGFYNGVVPYSSTPCTACVNTQIVPGINFNGAGSYTASTSPVPYTNGTVTLGYRWAPQKFIDLSPTYYGNNNVYLEPAFLEWDAHFGYPISKNLTLFATARNITGIYDQAIQTLQVTGVIPGIKGANSVISQYPYTFPTTFYGVPFGPRTVTVTLNYKM